MATDAPCVRAAFIEIVEPDPDECPSIHLPPEGNVKLRNYRLLAENLRAYTPTGDIHTSPIKGKLVSKYDVCASISPPRSRILELVREGEEGHDALQAIVRPAPRRLQRPLDEDARRFLQRALHSPSPCHTPAVSPEHKSNVNDQKDPTPPDSPEPTRKKLSKVGRSLSLAEELREAEEDAPGEFRDIERHEAKEAYERERMGRLALAVEEEEDLCVEGRGLVGCARRLDELLAESRALHEELAAIQLDLQVLARRLRRQP